MRRHWENCIANFDEDVDAFVADYFSNADRRVLLVAAAGFDPRSQRISQMLATALGDRLSAVYIREERPGASDTLVGRADQNEAALKAIVPDSDFISIDVFADDGAPVGGARIVSRLSQHLVPDEVTDVILDLSALSIGVGFPAARMLLEDCEATGDRAFHLMIVSNPEMDDRISSVPSSRPGSVKGFSPPVETDGQGLAQVWIPQLAKGRGLALTQIGGVVMDYDGTVVTTASRFGPPDSQIVEELIRLHGLGLRIGFATGRGGSAGEELRKVLPAEMLAAILIGYYNGGHVRSVDVDVDEDPAVADEAIAEMAAWLRERGDLFADHRFKHGAVQITIEMDRLLHPYRFAADLRDCAAFAEGRVRVTGSGHSYDIVPAASSKLAVVRELRTGLPTGAEVLCFGDSGSRPGNDHALLAHPFGISVGDVCAAADGCWSMFGAHPIGPEALLRILKSLVASDAGGIRLDLASLGLDR